MNEYAKVEDIEPEIVQYCDIYTADLSERLGLNETQLPNAVSFPTLLNPMFGNKKLIVGSGLAVRESKGSTASENGAHSRQKVSINKSNHRRCRCS